MLGQRESVVTITAVALQLSLLTPPFETLENRLILTRRIKDEKSSQEQERSDREEKGGFGFQWQIEEKGL
jgi:hypothetical protein